MTQFSPKTLLIAVCFMSFSLSQAQEFIEEPIHAKKYSSIIREISKENWLVYSPYDDFAWFTWIDHIGQVFKQTHSAHYTNALQVSDFEILDREYVFYCGRRRDSIGGAWHGVFGHFALSNFMTGNTFNEFKFEDDIYPEKLEVFRVEDEVHLAMVGKKRASKFTPLGVIIDAYGFGSLPTSWNVKMAERETLKYDDIAVTNNYVIVTSRDTTHNYGYIVSFLRPGPSSSFLPPISCNYSHYMAPYDVADTLLIEACDGDFIATATYSSSFNRNIVTAYNNTTLYATVTMPLLAGVSPILQIRDIKYNPFNKTLNLLQHFLYDGELSSVIFHLDSSLANPSNYPAQIKGNAFVYHKLSSIDRLFFNPNHVIASGHEMFPVENQWLKIYQHKESHYENCTKEIINECSFFGKENMEFTPRLEISNPRIGHIVQPRENNEGIIKNICK